MNVSDIFFIFSARGRGRGSLRRREGGGGFGLFIENPRRGGVSSGRGAEGPGRFMRQIGAFGGGGGLNIFFRGRNVHQIRISAGKAIQ